MTAALWRLLLAIALVCLGAACGTPNAPISDLPTASDQTEVQRRAQIRLQLAIDYFGQGQMTTALDEVKQALAIDPALADAYLVRALIYMELTENALAEENFRQALKLSPNNPDLANNYGWFLCQTGRAPHSIEWFERALASRQYLSPAKALNNAGMCSLRGRNFPAAEIYLTRALALDAGSPDVNLSLAKLNLIRGDLVRAREHVRMALGGPNPNADVIFTALKIERKAGNAMAESGLANELRRRFPNSAEYGVYVRGAFDD